MKVLVDTPIWSYALRSKQDRFAAQVKALAYLISDQRVLMIGPIRQEVLSGYSDVQKFKKLKRQLGYFDNEPILDADYVEAAQLSNLCRKKGIQGSHTDFLICAVSIRLKTPIFTTDKDFDSYRQYIPIQHYKT